VGELRVGVLKAYYCWGFNNPVLVEPILVERRW
jgi:hypothetical protein